MVVFSNFIIILFTTCVDAHPIEKKYSDVETDSKDEKRYPNGTVIGNYSYKDKEGNPVHVKYYADDTSYGVELKSFKILGSNLPAIPHNKPDPDYMKTDFKFDVTPGPLFDNNFKVDKDVDVSNDTKPKPDRKSEYEVLTENELKPEKCGGRVRVYYDKNNKRKIRTVFDPYETFRFCEQF